MGANRIQWKEKKRIYSSDKERRMKKREPQGKGIFLHLCRIRPSQERWWERIHKSTKESSRVQIERKKDKLYFGNVVSFFRPGVATWIVFFFYKLPKNVDHLKKKKRRGRVSTTLNFLYNFFFYILAPLNDQKLLIVLSCLPFFLTCRSRDKSTSGRRTNDIFNRNLLALSSEVSGSTAIEAW